MRLQVSDIGRFRRWAFFSLTDKTGAVEYAKTLHSAGFGLMSAGGTCKMLDDALLPVLDLAELVGGGAILGHKVLTLSREYAAGELADMLNPKELDELMKLALPFVDLVYCNLYNILDAVFKAEKDPNRLAAVARVTEATDIGGPNMLRAGAKGFRIVINRKCDMEMVLKEIAETGDVCYATRQELRWRAEAEVTKYTGHSAMFQSAGKFKVITGECMFEFKGENGPQSPAGLFSAGTKDPLALHNFKVVNGAAPSYNNWCDVDRLLQTMTHIAAGWKLNYGKVPYIAIGAKHGNLCGAAVNDSMVAACRDMVKGDTRAIFGGLIMTNFPINDNQAEMMAMAMPDGKARFDGVIAPSFTDDAVTILARAKGKCRIIVNPALEGDGSVILDTTPRFRFTRGGFLTEPNYTFLLDFNDPDLKVYGKRNARIEKSLLLAWGIGCTSNSNTITIIHGSVLIGNGVGQQDRVGAAELAIKRAKDSGHGLRLQRRGANVAFSDSFFPFPDAVQVLIDAGVSAIFSTSGSVNDKVIQDLCVNNGVALYQLPDSKARGFFGH